MREILEQYRKTQNTLLRIGKKLESALLYYAENKLHCNAVLVKDIEIDDESVAFTVSTSRKNGFEYRATVSYLYFDNPDRYIEQEIWAEKLKEEMP